MKRDSGAAPPRQQASAFALRESEECLNAIFDASPDAMLISDSSGSIVLASRRVEAVLGYTVEELRGQSIEALVPARFRADHAGLRANFTSEPSSRVMGHRRAIPALRKDGSECEVEVGLSQVATSVGTFAASSMRDITERLAVEESARERGGKLRHLFDLSPLGIVLTDMKGRFLEFNRAFQDICGYSESEAPTWPCTRRRRRGAIPSASSTRRWRHRSRRGRPRKPICTSR